MKPTKQKNKSSDPMICLCNAVPRSRIEEAIRRGCNTLGKLYDATRAGAGPCGGSCQFKLRQLLSDNEKK